MAREPEAGDVGGGVHARFEHGDASRAVELLHGVDGGLERREVDFPDFVCRAEQAHAEGLGQIQHVARHGAFVAHDAVRVHQAEHRQAVLRLRVVDGRPAHDGRARLRHGIGAAAQHLARHFVAERAVERQHVERARGLAAHGEHVGERVGRGDASEIVRVVDERREEIDGEDGGHVVGDAVDGGVIAGLEPEQQVIRVRGCVVGAFQDGREDVGEVSRTPLCSSTALRGELGKTYAFLIAQGARRCFVFV